MHYFLYQQDLRSNKERWKRSSNSRTSWPLKVQRSLDLGINLIAQHF